MKHLVSELGRDTGVDARYREMAAALLPNLADDVARWAREKPGAPAILEHSTGASVTWKQLDTSVSAFAAKLLSIGLGKGDVVATSLPLLKEHVTLIHACYRIGVLVAPLDLRLKAKEVQYCFDRIRPKATFFLGQTPVADFRPLVAEVMAGSPWVEHWVQFQKEPELVIPGAIGIGEFARDIKRVAILSMLSGSVRRAHRQVGKRDPCLVIFTTGSTGSPKPALLCHENVHLQNAGLAASFAMEENDRMLVNLPPSHVACVTEQLATTIYRGGTCVILPIFEAKASLEAIERHRVTVLGQIPALFNLEWQLLEYPGFDLSSLRFAIYGGQSVPRAFLEKMRAMAPCIGTGLGLTETAGFCTYTRRDAGVDVLASGIGFDMPGCPISIREPMKGDGLAGAEKGPGEEGEICFSGPQVFLGYLGDAAATARALSRDGVLYTGDVGAYGEEGLRFSGRRGLVIKPKGFQVFPEDVESHIVGALGGRAAAAACVGAEHEVFSEGIVAFVEPAAGAALSAEEVLAACRDMAAYARPSHVELVAPGEIPLNRVAKTDYLELRVRAAAIVERLRASGGWDR